MGKAEKEKIKKGKDRAKEKDKGMERQGRVDVGNISISLPGGATAAVSKNAQTKYPGHFSNHPIISSPKAEMEGPQEIPRIDS